MLYIVLTSDLFFIYLFVFVNGGCHFHIYVILSHTIRSFYFSIFKQFLSLLPQMYSYMYVSVLYILL